MRRRKPASLEEGLLPATVHQRLSTSSVARAAGNSHHIPTKSPVQASQPHTPLKRERAAGRETTSAPSVGHVLIKRRSLLGGNHLKERHLDSGSGNPDQATAIGNPLWRQSPASIPAREINADHSHTDSQGPVYKAPPPSLVSLDFQSYPPGSFTEEKSKSVNHRRDHMITSRLRGLLVCDLDQSCGFSSSHVWM